jgi:hypothetical protein
MTLPSFRSLLFLLLTPLVIVNPLTIQEASTGKDERQVVESSGLELTLRPFALSTVEAFLQGRGFTPKQAASVAQSACIHKLEIRHRGKSREKHPLTINLKQWQVHTLTTLQSPKIREEWSQRLEQAELSPSAQTAFNWALFPTHQIFWPGDYNWGLISFGLPANRAFELEISWQIEGKNQKKIIKQLQCGQ